MSTTAHKENTGRGKFLSAREIMEELNIGRALLRKHEKAGMPRVCLNPDSVGTHGRRYRYSLGAVLAWLEGRNTAEAPAVTAPTAEQKGVER
ncbi:MAG: hypothetical protein PUD60_06375 [Akkermansia muciniphila]|nr:hypothetical protein [Akkermansia muciniphila]